MTEARISHRDRVNLALAHKSADRVPMDFAAEPKVWQKLMDYFGVSSKEEILQRLDVDCRIISYDFEVFCRPGHLPAVEKPGTATWRHTTEQGIKADIWGARRRYIKNEFAEYEELCDYPLSNAESIDDLKKYNWACPDWWDFGGLDDVIDKLNPNHEYHLRYRIGSILETAWSLYGLDRFLMDLALRPDMVCYIMDRINEVHIENLKRVLDIAGDKIDMVYSYDDLAGQQGLLMSPEMWKSTVKLRQEKLFGLARSYDKPVMYHCCGNIGPLIDDLIDIGVSVLNPIQPLALKMDFETLKQKFGDRLSFHGGIDIQELLPNGTAQQVAEEVERAKKILGEDGGYILAPAHHIQADTPVENVLAIYQRKKSTA